MKSVEIIESPKETFVIERPLPSGIVRQGDTIDLVATGSISSGRLIALVGGQVVYYDCTQASHHMALLGISVTSANFGQPLQIQIEGLVHIPGFGLTTDQVYRAGSGGQLVTTSPLNAAFNQVVGRAKDSNTLIFSPQSPIIL
jgi:predicted RecA/RadA family phage recombinase